MGFVMDRSVERWKTWYVNAIPNIGIFLCKGNSKTVRMFDAAWVDYQVCYVTLLVLRLGLGVIGVGYILYIVYCI